MASKRIQGITVEIGGDTSKLTAALKDVDRSLSTTQGNLRDVNRLLKLDPGNTELLAQKHKLLAEAIKETKERLATLKTAAEQANQALANGEITQTQYDALQREIIETEEKLKGLESQAGASAVALQKIANVGTTFQNIGGKIEGVGKSLLPLSTAVAGIGVAGIKVASDFEKAMSGVQAITGATGSDFEKLRDTAIDLGASTSFSSGEVAEAMTEMAKAGWSTTQIIDGMAGVLDATAASGENLGSVATIVADAITGFGLSAKDSATVADLMTQAANSGTIGITDLGESYKYIAPMAQSMGLSIQDVTTALSAMSMAGIKGSQAGTSLRTVLANMAKPSKTVAGAMKELDICITNSDGSFQSLNEIVTIMRTKFSGLTDDQKAYYATALAGKEGMSGLLSLLNLTQGEYDALSTSMNTCNGVAGQTASVMQNNLQSKVEQLGGALESLAIKLSEYVIPFLTDLVVKITAAVDAFTNLSPGVQKAVLVIGGMIAVAAPLLIIIGKVISAVGTIMTIVPAIGTAIHAVTAAFGALNAVMLANPIGLIIAAIVALIAIFVLLWNHCDGFREFWINLWEEIKETAVAVWNALKDFFKGIWEAIANIAKGLWEGLKSFFSAIWDGIKAIFETVLNVIKALITARFEFYLMIITTTLTVIKTVVETVWNAIKNVIEVVMAAISNFISSAWEGIKNVVSTVLNAIRSVMEGTWNAIKNVVTSAMDVIKNVIESVWNAIKSVITTIVDSIKETVTTTWNAIKDAVTVVMNAIKDVTVSIWNAIKDAISSAITAIKDVAISAWNTIKDAVVSIMNGIKDTMISIWNAIRDAVSSVLDGIKNAVNLVFNSIVSGISSAMSNVFGAVRNGFNNVKEHILHLASEAWGWGKDIIMGIVDGIKSAIGHVKDAVCNVADTIKSFLHFSVPDEGPLTDYESWMPDFMGGLAKGICDSRGMIQKAVKMVTEDMTIVPSIQAVSMEKMGLENIMEKVPGAMLYTGGVSEKTEDSAGINSRLDAMNRTLSRYLPKMADSKIVLDSGTLVGELSDGLNRQLGKAYL
ncbi:phage tail tape measure protein [Kineothrix alysoides]|uniref:phage tail tape measure protein n=1 Tax=Kineothrix alysoides TaxID=1469948 RepID=UPI0005550B0D|nr:phage tail tape measure protein [Kineothrix alysoides]